MVPTGPEALGLTLASQGRPFPNQWAWLLQRSKDSRRSKFQVKIAILTAKESILGLACHWLKNGLLLVIYPATGALILGSDHRSKVTRTLGRAPYVRALHSYLRHPSVQLSFLAVEYRKAKLRSTCYLSGNCLKPFESCHRGSSSALQVELRHCNRCSQQ